MTVLQACRGVSSECPENTMPAFLLAMEQGYTAVEADPAVTKDGQVVLHRDSTPDRTGRKADGKAADSGICLEEYTYEELCGLDFGVWKHPKFAGTGIPLLSELLSAAREAGVAVKLSEKVFAMSAAHRKVLFDMIQNWQDVCQLAVVSAEQALSVHLLFPDMKVHYEGLCRWETLEKLKAVLGKERLHIWLPYPNLRTAGLLQLSADDSRIPALTAEQVRKVEKYGKVCVRNLADEAEFAEVQLLGVFMAATNGEVKPPKNEGVLSDMHVHTDHSHDARIPMEEMYAACREKNIKIIAAADHYDGCFCADGPYSWEHIRASNREADAITARYDGDGRVLRSIEMGEPQWDPMQSKRVIAESNFDAVVGAIHAVKSPMFADAHLLKRCFSQLKFDQLTAGQTQELLRAYYRDNLEMVQTQDIDICAHLTCAVSYFLQRQGLYVSVEQFREEIVQILRVLIDKGIALEVNFSGLPSTGVMSPHIWILEQYRQMGGYLIVMATDAHSPAGCGAGYDEGIRILKKLGFRHTYYYKDRKPVQCTLL